MKAEKKLDEKVAFNIIKSEADLEKISDLRALIISEDCMKSCFSRAGHTRREVILFKDCFDNTIMLGCEEDELESKFKVQIIYQK